MPHAEGNATLVPTQERRDAIRIVIIGGGSYAWAPLFIRDFAVSPELAGSTIVLHDRDPQPLELLYALGQKVIRAGDLPVTLEKTVHLEEALKGAGFAILTITTGGLEAMRRDLEIPENYGIYQSVGDTVGPGGLARALRNIPVVVGIAQRMEDLCPDAWLLNYTNPMTTLCRSVTRETEVRTIGLCHEYLSVYRRLQKLFGVGASDLDARLGGINHLAWILDLSVRGRDVMPQLRELAKQMIASKGQILGFAEVGTPLTADRAMVKARLLLVYGAFPAAGDRHLAEFFPFFLNHAAGRGKKYGVERTAVGQRYEWRAEDERFVRSMLDGKGDLESFLTETSGEAAGEIIVALMGGRTYTGPLNLPNQGQIANLPLDVVVETLGVVDVHGARGLPVGSLPPGVQAVVARHVANQELIVEAALTGTRSLALQALVNDPLLCDLDGAEQMLDEMLEANRRYLPRFFGD